MMLKINISLSILKRDLKKHVFRTVVAVFPIIFFYIFIKNCLKFTRWDFVVTHTICLYMYMYNISKGLFIFYIIYEILSSYMYKKTVTFANENKNSIYFFKYQNLSKRCNKNVK